MKSKAIIAYDKKKVEIREVEIGELGEWDILVELEYSAISTGTEGYVLSHTDDFHLPYIPGYGPIGRIIEVGTKASKDWNVGDRVSYFTSNYGQDVSGRKLNNDVVANCGGHLSPAIKNVDPSKYSDNNHYCVKVPEALPSNKACFGGISSISSNAVSLANPNVGDKVLVMGQGIIGQMAAQHFQLRGAELAVADLYEKRVEIAKESGANIAINASNTDIFETIKSAWPDGADIIVDVTTNFKLIESSLSVIKNESKYVFLAMYSQGEFPLRKLQGIVYRAYFPWCLWGSHTLNSWDLMSNGRLKIDHLITHTFDVKDAQDAYDLVFDAPQDYLGINLNWESLKS